MYFFAGGVLHARRDRDAGGFDRAFAQNRKFLEHEFQIGIGLQQLEHVGQRALAVAAIVIEELDHRDVAVRIAEHDLVRRTEKRRVVLDDGGAMLLGFGRLLALFQLGHHVLHHFGVREQIVLDDAFDFVPLVGGKRLRLRRRRRLATPASMAAAIRIAVRGLDVIAIVLFAIIDRFEAGFFPLLKATMSSALTQPGEPMGNRFLARAASSRAVLLSPRAKAACAEARSASARSPLWP